MTKQKYFKPHLGSRVQLKTVFGDLSGYVEQVTEGAVLLRMPADAAPRLVSCLAATPDVELAGGCCGGCHPYPYWRCGPWFWCWIPFVFILVLPFFCW